MKKCMTFVAALGVFLSAISPASAQAAGPELQFLGPSTFAAPATLTVTSRWSQIDEAALYGGCDGPASRCSVYTLVAPATSVVRTGPDGNGRYRFDIRFEQVPTGSVDLGIVVCSDLLTCEGDAWDVQVTGSSAAPVSVTEWRRYVHRDYYEPNRCLAGSELFVGNAMPFTFRGKYTVERKVRGRWRKVATRSERAKPAAFASPGLPLVTPEDAGPLVFSDLTVGVVLEKSQVRKLGKAPHRVTSRYKVKAKDGVKQKRSKTQRLRKKQCKRPAPEPF